MREHLVQPLQGAVEVQLDPAGGAGHRLPPGEQNQTLVTDTSVCGTNKNAVVSEGESGTGHIKSTSQIKKKQLKSKK